MTRLFTILFLLHTITTSGQTPELSELFTDQALPLSIVNGSFTGPGGEMMAEILQQSDYILVGEQHGLRESSEFVKTLLLQGEKYGYHTLAIETDPYVASNLEEIHRSQDPLSVAMNRNQDMPFLMPFYENTDDHNMLSMLDYSGKNVLWGLDQVFMGATRLIFEKLAAIAITQEQRNISQNFLQKAMGGVRKVLETRNFQFAPMLQLTSNDFQLLRDAFVNHEMAINLINDLQRSKEIYLLNFSGQIYENNLLRSKLIKQRFFQYYNRAKTNGTDPKIIFKFGDTHMAKGHSFTDVLDIGNAVFEKAEAEGKRSTHILFHAIKGTSNAFNPVSGDEAKRVVFDRTEKIPAAIFNAVAQKGQEGKWVLFDLRPLRKYVHKMEGRLKSYVLNFDFYLVIPEAHATGNF